MRNIQIALGEHYHIFNRGVTKQLIFHDTADWSRFLFLILYFQSPRTFPQIGREVKIFTKNVQHRVFDIETTAVKQERYVELVAFSLMPNHFHLILKEVDEGGIARYMQRILNSYSKYYNTKYGKSGHLFQGPYKAVHVEGDQQLLYLSAYIHRNHEKWRSYFWSSYKDFILENRWKDLLVPNIITEQFKNSKKYQEFVETSTAKEIKEEIGL